MIKLLANPTHRPTEVTGAVANFAPVERIEALVLSTLDEIPQATSRKLTQPKTMVEEEPFVTVCSANVGDDDLPF